MQFVTVIRSRASGHVEIEGFLPSSVLRLCGYKIKSQEKLSEHEERRKFLDLLELWLVQFPCGTFPVRHALRASFIIEEIFNLTKIDRWLLVQIKEIVDV